jgi:hypothetical protein
MKPFDILLLESAAHPCEVFVQVGDSDNNPFTINDD